jgi:hypothetical protein
MIRHKSGTQWPDDREVGWRRVWFTLYTWRRWEGRVFWFSLKTGGDGLSVVWPQNHCDNLLVWASKPRATVSWFVPQNQVGGGLSVCASKPMSRWRPCEDIHCHPAACFITKQVGLGFPSFASKLVKERRLVVHVASSWKSCVSEAKDDQFDGVGCSAVEVRPNYPSWVVIFLLAHKGILVFYFRYK